MKKEGILKGRGTQRTDSLMILSAVRQLNRLELVMETMRLALEEIAEEYSAPQCLDKNPANLR